MPPQSLQVIALFGSFNRIRLFHLRLRSHPLLLRGLPRRWDGRIFEGIRRVQANQTPHTGGEGGEPRGRREAHPVRRRGDQNVARRAVAETMKPLIHRFAWTSALNFVIGFVALPLAMGLQEGTRAETAQETDKDKPKATEKKDQPKKKAGGLPLKP